MKCPVSGTSLNAKVKVPLSIGSSRCLSFYVLYRPSSVCNTRFETLVFCPLSPSARSLPLHLTRSSPQLHVSYPALHSLGLGPTFNFPPCSSLSRHQTPCFCLTRPVYFFFSASAGVVGLVRGFYALPDLIHTRAPRKPHFHSNPTSGRHSTIRQSDNPPSDNPTTDAENPFP